MRASSSTIRANSGLKLAAARTIARISAAENGSTSGLASATQSAAAPRIGLDGNSPMSTAWSRTILSPARAVLRVLSARSPRSSAIRRRIESREKFSDVTLVVPSLGRRWCFKNQAWPALVLGCSFRVCAYSFVASSATVANVGTAAARCV